MPRMGKAVDDYELNAKGYRVLVVKKHYVFYLISDEDQLIEIYRVLSNRQDYLQCLGDTVNE